MESDIHRVDPPTGQDGTKVVITGVELIAGASKLSSVTLAGIDAGSITKQEATRIELVAAASPNAKRGDVVLTSENGAQIAMVNGWTYVNPPQINELDPDEPWRQCETCRYG